MKDFKQISFEKFGPESGPRLADRLITRHLAASLIGAAVALGATGLTVANYIEQLNSIDVTNAKIAMRSDTSPLMQAAAQVASDKLETGIQSLSAEVMSKPGPSIAAASYMLTGTAGKPILVIDNAGGHQLKALDPALFDNRTVAYRLAASLESDASSAFSAHAHPTLHRIEKDLKAAFGLTQTQHYFKETTGQKNQASAVTAASSQDPVIFAGKNACVVAQSLLSNTLSNDGIEAGRRTAPWPVALTSDQRLQVVYDAVRTVTRSCVDTVDSEVKLFSPYREGLYRNIIADLSAINAVDIEYRKQANDMVWIDATLSLAAAKASRYTLPALGQLDVTKPPTRQYDRLINVMYSKEVQSQSNGLESASKYLTSKLEATTTSARNQPTLDEDGKTKLPLVVADVAKALWAATLVANPAPAPDIQRRYLQAVESLYSKVSLPSPVSSKSMYPSQQIAALIRSPGLSATPNILNSYMAELRAHTSQNLVQQVSLSSQTVQATPTQKINGPQL